MKTTSCVWKKQKKKKHQRTNQLVRSIIRISPRSKIIAPGAADCEIRNKISVIGINRKTFSYTAPPNTMHTHTRSRVISVLLLLLFLLYYFCHGRSRGDGPGLSAPIMTAAGFVDAQPLEKKKKRVVKPIRPNPYAYKIHTYKLPRPNPIDGVVYSRLEND